MSIRNLILRALIALSMLFGVAGASQAVTPTWVRTNGNVGYVTLEVEQQVLAGVTRDSLWQRFLSKVSWGKVATRAAGAGCAIAGATAVTSDSYAQQRTWWLKGLRMVSSCAAGVAAGALLDFTQAALLSAAAPELVAFGAATMIGAAVGFGLELAVEKLWAAHTTATGEAVGDANGVTPPRRDLMVYDDEYASISRTYTHLANIRHPQSKWDNGWEISPSTATHVGWDPVGGTWMPRYKPYVPPPGGGRAC